MADNTAITPGAGATIRTDDVGGIQYQVVKLDGGGDGLTVPIVAGQGTMAASLPVVIASDQAAVQVGANGVSVSGSATTGTPAGGATILSMDLLNAGSVIVHIITRGVGTDVFEGSNDNTNWIQVSGFLPVNGNSPTSSGISIGAGGYATFPSYMRYFRYRLSAYTSGTFAAVAVARSAPILPAENLGVRVSGTVSLSANSAAIGDVGIQYRTNNTGGATPKSVLSPATPGATTIKATAGRLLGVCLQNSAASLRSVKIFHNPIGSVTLGTTAADYEIDIPAGGQVTWNLEGGLGSSVGICYAITSAKGLTDNTSTGLATNDVSGVIFYA